MRDSARAPGTNSLKGGAVDKIKIAGIVNDSIVDGPGLRFAIFTQGCLKNCPGCHNQPARALSGGTEYSAGALFRMLKDNPLLSGVTLSGGEPLLQAGSLIPLAQMIRETGYDLAIYTGYTLEEILAENDAEVLLLLSLADTLIDGPFIMERRDIALSFRGSSNQRILNAAESLKARTPVLERGALWTAEI
jgi:anaerobic ribonucleoside-triphosphate reductase activating protein